MFYFCMGFILLLNLLLLFVLRKKRCLLIHPGLLAYSAGLLFAFLVLSLCMAVYMAKSVYYSNVLERLFFLPKRIWQEMMWLPISKDALNRVMNVASLSFTLLSWRWATGMDPSPARRKGPYDLLTALAVAVACDPAVAKAVYALLFPRYIGYVPYRLICRWLSALLLCLRVIIHGFCIYRMGRKALSLSGFREMRVSTALILSFSILIQTLFLALFYWTPSSLSQYHVYARVAVSRNIPLAYSYGWLNLLLGVQVVCFCVIAGCLVYQLRFENLLLREKQSLSRSMRDASLISRTFAHYMKNEVLAIRMEVEMARDQPLAQAREALERIHARCEGIGARLDRMKIFKPNKLSMIQMDVREVLDAAIQSSRRRAPGVRFVFCPPERPISLWVDPLLMSEALLTLLQNAGEAVEGLPDQRREVEVSIRQHARVVEIRISDQGEGIQPERMAHIFEPYYTSKPASTNWGLGLYLCRQIISAHDGRLDIQSKPGHGTAASVYLPMCG